MNSSFPPPSAALLFASLAILSSCAVLPAVRGIGAEPPARFGSPAACVPSWTPLAAGLDAFFFRVADPPMAACALRADLSAPGLSAVAAGEPVAPAATVSRRTTSFLDEYGLAAAVNATPFAPSSAREGERRVLTGLMVSGGVVVSPPDGRYAALVFRDGRASVVSQASLRSLDGIDHAVGGFFAVLRNGEPFGHPHRRYARTAAGVSADGRTLYLLVVDGGRRASGGATEPETGVLLARLGAADGLILDGGGSSAMALRDADGRPVRANVPVHGGVPGRERAVGNALGIRVPP